MLHHLGVPVGHHGRVPARHRAEVHGLLGVLQRGLEVRLHRLHQDDVGGHLLQHGAREDADDEGRRGAGRHGARGRVRRGDGAADGRRAVKEGRIAVERVPAVTQHAHGHVQRLEQVQSLAAIGEPPVRHTEEAARRHECRAERAHEVDRRAEIDQRGKALLLERQLVARRPVESGRDVAVVEGDLERAPGPRCLRQHVHALLPGPIHVERVLGGGGLTRLDEGFQGLDQGVAGGAPLRLGKLRLDHQPGEDH